MSSAANPSHTLLPYSHDAPAVRALLNSMVSSSIKGDIAQASPLVSWARNMAVAAQQELETLEGNVEAATLQLQANRDALVASAHESYDTQLAALMSVASERQMALQIGVVSADNALEASIEATSAATEVLRVIITLTLCVCVRLNRVVFLF